METRCARHASWVEMPITRVPGLLQFPTMGVSDAIMTAAVQRAVLRWPGIDATAPALRAHIESQVLTDEALAENAEDIFLAAACVAGDPSAIKHLDRAYLSRVGTFIARVATAPHLVDEVTQEVRIRLFAGDNPRIAHYRAEGPLEAWVRVVALRTALQVLKTRRPERHLPIDEMKLSDALSPFLRADNVVQGAQLQPAVQNALTVALESLPARSKAILRLHFVEHLNIEEIGNLYRVHRATVARWLVSIRQDLFAKVQKDIEVDLRVTPSEFRSLLGAVRDDLHASLSRILPPAPQLPDPRANGA